jgi:AraC-like DNA-binding protein
MLAAPSPLQPFVEHIWTQGEMPATVDLAWRIPPDANPYLIFTAWASAAGAPRTRCMLVGPCAGFRDIPVRGRVFTCGIRLRPGVLPLLTGLPASELTGQAVSVTDIFGARGRQLLERLGEPSSWHEAPLRLAAFLAREFAKHRHFRSLPVRQADSVRDLAEIAGLATRTLHYRVTQDIGLAPKLWLRIERLHRAIAGATNRVVPWSDVAAHCGYADQAHLVREFSELLGEPPTVWSRRNPFLPMTESVFAD